MFSQMTECAIPTKPRQSFKICFTLLIVSFMLFLVSNITAYNLAALKENMNQPIHGFFIIFSNFTFQNLLIGYMMIIYLIYHFLSSIDIFLNQILHNRHMNEIEMVNAVKVIRMTIDKLCDILINVQHCFMVNTIFFLNYYSFFVIFTVYSTISVLFLPDMNLQDFVFLALSYVWTFYNLLFFVWIFVISSWIKSKSNKIEATSYKLLQKYEKSKKYCKSIELLSSQIFHRQPLISLGVFVVDWKNLFYVLGFSFTQIIIIMQFEIKV